MRDQKVENIKNCQFDLPFECVDAAIPTCDNDTELDVKQSGDVEEYGHGRDLHLQRENKQVTKEKHPGYWDAIAHTLNLPITILKRKT